MRTAPARARTRLAVVAALLVALAMIVVAAPPALAASCYASSCTGKHPISTGCSADAITAKQNSGAGMTVQLRYSRTCRAAWARVFGDPVNSWFVRNNLYQYGYLVPYTNYSYMVNDANLVAQACVANAADYFVCTGWY